MPRMLLAALLATITGVTACAPVGPSGGGSAQDQNGQCAARPIQVVPVNYTAPKVISYTFVASVLDDDCNLTGLNGPPMVVNVVMRQTDPSGKHNPVAVMVDNREVRSPWSYNWAMDKGYVHELLGDAIVHMTAGQIDDWNAGFLECYWLMNGKPMPAAMSKFIVAREIKPIRPNQDTIVECHGNLPTE